MIYLASPYSDPDPAVVEKRYNQTRDFVHTTTLQKLEFIFSPIVYFHPGAVVAGSATDAKTWENINERILLYASKVFILTLTEWERSKGVRKELQWAQFYCKPVFCTDLSGNLSPFDRSMIWDG